MKRIYIVFLLLFLIISNAKILYGQWVESHGPLGCYIHSFYVSGNRIFTLTSDSIYISTNNGRSWAGINNGFKPDSSLVRSFTAIDSNLFVITYGGAYFHSTNTGKSWEPYIIDSISGAPIWDFAVCDNNLFAGTYGAGVFKSSDDGVSWDSINNGLGDLYINHIKAENGYLFAWNKNGIFITSDAGISWNLIASEDKGFNEVVAGDSILFANLSRGASAGIYYSTDMGKNWIQFSNAPPVSGINVILAKGKDLFAGTFDGSNGGVFLTTDNGANWTALNNGLICQDVSNLAMTDSVLFAGTQMTGAHMSTNYGNSWIKTGKGVKDSIGLAIMSLTVYNHHLFAGTWGGGIFSSQDSGINWEAKNNGLDIKFIISLAVQGNSIFAGTTLGKVFVSDNNGDSWTEASNGLPYAGKEYYSLPLAASGNYLFAGFPNDTAGVYRTTDAGLNWTSVKNNLPVQVFRFVSSIAATNSIVFIGGYSSVYYSTDEGVNWIADTTGLPFSNVEISSLAIIDTNIFAGTASHGIYKSTIYGAPWKQVNTELDSSARGHIINCMAVTGQNLIAGLSGGAYPGGGIYVSTNLGESWTNVNPGLTDLNINALATDGADVYVGAGGQLGHGIWSRPLSQIITSVNGIKNNVPSEFLLLQNYPNPFNPVTTISYIIPKTSWVTLKVYDILGREVSTMVDKNERTGKYSVTFKGDNLSSGVYFYQLKAGNFTETKKLLLLK